jgi:hypothetical protein
MPKRPPKTPKEKKFVKEYAKTGNATEAAARVYDVKDRESARAIGSEILAKLDLSSLMDEMGLTDERLLKVLDEGLKAINRNKLGETPDHPTRHKFLDTALKLKDKYPAGKIDHSIKGAMEVPGLVQLLHKYVTPGDQSTTEGNSEAEG